MSAQLIHTKLINQAAREVFKPLGIVQKGRSRIWLDDHGWWLAVIEFQPSGWSQGTYLNVGVHWLWSGHDSYSFDLGYRVEGFTEFRDESQFEQATHRMVERAFAEVLKYRALCRSIHAVANILRNEPILGGWQLYHAGVACGLAGRGEDAQRFLAKLISEEPVIQKKEGAFELDWHVQLRERAVNLVSLLSNAQEFRIKVAELISNTRETLGLRQWDQLIYEELSA